MYRQVPNLITLGRLLLPGLFFAAINRHVGLDGICFWMWLCFALFVLAGLSDILDGYLARSWKVESAFGRVVDPFADKILICGAFIFFSSRNFLDPHLLLLAQADTVTKVTGVAPWMAVVLVAREFLITGIRGLAESRGIDFRAQWAGKIKMLAQSIAVGAVLGSLATSFRRGGFHPVMWIVITRDIFIWLTLGATVASALEYVHRARRIMEA